MEIVFLVAAVLVGLVMVGLAVDSDRGAIAIPGIFLGAALAMFGIIGSVAMATIRYEERQCVEVISAESGFKTRWTGGICWVELPDGKKIPYERWADEGD